MASNDLTFGVGPRMGGARKCVWRSWGILVSLVSSAVVSLAAEEATQPPAASAPPFVPVALTAPEGFTVEVAAAPPLVAHPLMGAFDEKGRLYLAANAGENLDRPTLEKRLPNFVQRLEDTNGDGIFDRVTMFADKMTFPQGCLWHEGALYVASSGALWKFIDADDDGVAEQRQKLVGDFGYIGNAADVHGPFRGPDGRIYWCEGRHGHDIKDSAGNQVSRGKAGRIFCVLPDGSDVRTFCTGGMDNPVEVVFTPQGEMLGTVNLMYDKPRGDCLVHWQYGGVYPRTDFATRFAAEFVRTGELLPEVHNFGHVALSGMCRLESDALGPEYSGSYFLTVFNSNRIARMKLKPAPATFGVESISDFLVSKNRDFRPTDILEDADGSLLVIDTGGWFHNGCPQSKVAKADVLGAIYRIRRASTAKVKDPRGMELDWKTLAPRDFSQRMADPRPAVRERAIAVLAAELRQQTKVEEAAPFVREFSQSQPDVRQRWIDALGRANTRSTLSLVADALADPEPRLRQTASRVLLFADANRLPNADVLFEKLIEEVRAGPPDNRRAALATLGQMFSRRTHFVASLLAATPDCEQERLQFHALAYALIASGDRHALAEELQRGNPFRQKAAAAALEALRAMRSGNTPATWIEFPAPFQSKPLREEERRAFLAIEGNLPSGDKTRGQALFNSDQASCAKCHRVGSTGGEVGPDLSTIGRSRSSRDLLEALLFPSSNFSRGFAPYSVITKDGASFTGIVLGEKPDQVRIGIDATHANWISASNIESIKPAETSIMPQDIVQRLKPEQLADLLAYLNSLQ